MKKSMFVGIALLLFGVSVSLSIACTSVEKAFRQPVRAIGVEMIELMPEELYKVFPPSD